jgi:hypothetical protein
MLVRESRTRSANGAFGRHDLHDSEGMTCVTAAVVLVAVTTAALLEPAIRAATNPRANACIIDLGGACAPFSFLP